MRSAAHDDAPVLECQEGGDAVVGRQLLHALVYVVRVLQQLVLVREQTGQRGHAVRSWARRRWPGRRRVGVRGRCPLRGSRRMRHLRGIGKRTSIAVSARGSECPSIALMIYHVISHLVEM